MKIRPMGAEFFHKNRRTDMTKLTVAFRNFAKAPINACENYRANRCIASDRVNSATGEREREREREREHKHMLWPWHVKHSENVCIQISTVLTTGPWGQATSCAPI